MDVRPGQPRAPRSRVFRLLPWLPSYAAVALMLGLLVFALVSLRPAEPRRAATPVPPPATPPFLAGPTGAAPIAAGKAAPLRFHFDRDGPVPTPATCSVNGTGCTLTTPT